MVGVAPWRIVPVFWAILGLGIPIAILKLIGLQKITLPVGELWTPILAGVALAGIVETINGVNDGGWQSAETLCWAAVSVAAIGSCALLLKSSRTTSLSLTPLRSPTMLLLLSGVAQWRTP